MKSLYCALNLLLILCFSEGAAGASGKLLATPGVSTIEGSAGGGIVPWAQLAGYASRDELSASAFCGKVQVKDFHLRSCGLQANIYDRLEVSFADQVLTVEPLNLDIQQQIVGAKLRLYGDIVYSRWPQLSLGVQLKDLHDPEVAYSLGAREDSGTDIYLAASKLHLAGLMGYNVFWNVSLRSTDANQIGLLGFGADGRGRHIEIEAAAAVFLKPEIALGVEFRQKPTNLSVVENDWFDVFVAWFPAKSLNVTVAYVDLGAIANLKNQRGWYLSFTGNL